MFLFYFILMGTAYALLFMAYVVFWCVAAMIVGAWAAFELIAEVCVRCYRGYNKLYPKHGERVYDPPSKPKWPGPPPPDLRHHPPKDSILIRHDPPPGVPRRSIGVK